MTNEEALDKLKAHTLKRKHTYTERQAFDMAFKAMEKQIPMAVTRFMRNRSKEVIGIGRCPSCGAIVSEYSSYCNKCGQKLDWGDEDAKIH